MADSSAFMDCAQPGKYGRSRFGEPGSRLLHEAYGDLQEVPEKDHKTGVDASGTQLPPGESATFFPANPPSPGVALEWRRGEISDHLAGWDRILWRGIGCFSNIATASRFARNIEPKTPLERKQLGEIEAAMANSSRTEMAKLAREREQILAEIETRGKSRGPLCVLGVTAAEYGVDRLLFPSDHVKYGTLVSDIVGQPVVMFLGIPWRYKAVGMVGVHAAGRIYDHFLQKGEHTNAHKPNPPWAKNLDDFRRTRPLSMP